MTRVKGWFEKQLKNRSSKHLRWFTGPGSKPAVWSWSTERLQKASAAHDGKGVNQFEAELNRRSRNAAKRKTPRPGAKKPAAQKNQGVTNG